MLFEESSRDPLVNGEPNVFDELSSSGLISFLSLLNGFEEELDETLQRVLIHVINDAQRNAQEIEHGSFSCHWTIQFSLSVNINFSDLGNLTLFSNGNGSCLRLLEIVDQLFIFEDG